MIIKQTRIRTGGTYTALDYIQAKGGNEDVELLYGDPSSLARFVNTMSSMNNHAYVLRHFIISPEQELNDVQIERCIEAIQDEFDTGDRPYVVARHQKIRADENDASHIHFMMAESNTSGRVLTNKNNFKRNEKICRNLELEFGFEVIKGRHNRYVVENTENPTAKMGLYLIGIADGDLPNSAFTKVMQGKAKRVGVDLPKLHKALRDVQKISNKHSKDRAEFIIQRLLVEDISLKKGDKEGVLILYKYDEKSQKDFEFGSLQRLTKLTKENILEIYPHIKTKEEKYEQDNRRKTSNDRRNTHRNIIHYGRSKPTYRWSNTIGGDSGKASRDTKTADFRYRQNSRHSLSHKQTQKLSALMINLKEMTREKFPKGIAGSLSHSNPSSGVGPVITDVFNDGSAALRAATNSIAAPRF